MLNTAEPRVGRSAVRNAPKQNSRAWLAQMQEAGELVTVTGAAAFSAGGVAASATAPAGRTSFRTYAKMLSVPPEETRTT